MIIAALCTLVKQLRNTSAFTAGREPHAINQDQGHTYQMSANETTELRSDREKLAVKNNKNLGSNYYEYALHFQFALAFELIKRKINNP